MLEFRSTERDIETSPSSSAQARHEPAAWWCARYAAGGLDSVDARTLGADTPETKTISLAPSWSELLRLETTTGAVCGRP